MIITDAHKSIDERYKKWFKEIDKAARVTVGKTTVKTGGKEKSSREVCELQNIKRDKKKEIRDPQNTQIKPNLICEYKDIQNQIHDQIVREKTVFIENKFNQTTADRSRSAFWKEKK